MLINSMPPTGPPTDLQASEYCKQLCNLEQRLFNYYAGLYSSKVPYSKFSSKVGDIMADQINHFRKFIDNKKMPDTARDFTDVCPVVDEKEIEKLAKLEGELLVAQPDYRRSRQYIRPYAPVFVGRLVDEVVGYVLLDPKLVDEKKIIKNKFNFTPYNSPKDDARFIDWFFNEILNEKIPSSSLKRYPRKNKPGLKDIHPLVKEAIELQKDFGNKVSFSLTGGLAMYFILSDESEGLAFDYPSKREINHDLDAMVYDVNETVNILQKHNYQPHPTVGQLFDIKENRVWGEREKNGLRIEFDAFTEASGQVRACMVGSGKGLEKHGYEGATLYTINRVDLLITKLSAASAKSGTIPGENTRLRDKDMIDIYNLLTLTNPDSWDVSYLHERIYAQDSGKRNSSQDMIKSFLRLQDFTRILKDIQNKSLKPKKKEYAQLVNRVNNGTFYTLDEIYNALVRFKHQKLIPAINN